MRLTSFAPLLLLIPACVVVDDTDADLLVSNRSDFEIREMYVTDVDSPDWGPNLIAGDVLLPNEQLSVVVPCGTYDAMLVDDTDATCEITSVDLCFEDATWVIRNSTCAIFEQRAAAMAKAAASK